GAVDPYRAITTKREREREREKRWKGKINRGVVDHETLAIIDRLDKSTCNGIGTTNRVADRLGCGGGGYHRLSQMLPKRFLRYGICFLTLFARPNDDAWDLNYVAAGQDIDVGRWILRRKNELNNCQRIALPKSDVVAKLDF
ncbi:hypothetical protein M8C21_003705, partial [Ambrosia artemisiifolia]